MLFYASFKRQFSSSILAPIRAPDLSIEMEACCSKASSDMGSVKDGRTGTAEIPV